MTARYLNVDCVLRSKESLDQLALSFDERIILLWNDVVDAEHSVGFEVFLDNPEAGPQETIDELLHYLAALPPAMKSLLKKCDKKILDIGFEAGPDSHLDASLDAAVIGRIYAAGFSLNIRIYPPCP